MIGGIIGDIIGSTYEVFNTKKENFKLFRFGSRYTDDTVLMFATLDCFLNNGDYGEYYRNYCLKYKFRGYGPSFLKWSILNKKKPYNSMGNGSAMRVIPIGFLIENEEDVLAIAKQSAEVTHNHPEGIIGAQALTLAIYYAHNGYSKEFIREGITKRFQYDLNMSFIDLKKVYKGGGTCAKTVPQAIISFLDSSNFEDAIRKAISLGGDSDTIAAMTGALAEAYYKEIPQELIDESLKRLPKEFESLLKEFNHYKIKKQS